MQMGSMRRRDVLGLAGIAWSGSTPAGAEAPTSGSPLHGLTEALAPLSYEEGPQVTGYAVELLRLLAQRSGRPLDVSVLPWARAQALAEQDRSAVLFPTARTPERESQYRWLGPLLTRRLWIYRLTSRRELPRPSLSPPWAQGRERIGVAMESASAHLLQARGLRMGQELEPGLSDAHNLQKLLRGRMAYVVMLDWAMAWHLQQLGLPYRTVAPLVPLDEGTQYWYALNRRCDSALLQSMQQALDTLKKSGELAPLRRRYLDDNGLARP